MTQWQLAQINVATALHDIDGPEMAGFTGRLDEINAIADAAPGFVWRLQSGEGNATDILLFPDNPRFIVNMSVWRDFESFSDFVFRSGHLELMQARHRWFQVSREPTHAMWWIPAGSAMPTPVEGWERLLLLREQGPTPAAFPLKRRYDPPRDSERRVG